MSTQPLRRSRRLATIIPVSDWISIGYSEDDAKLMNQIQQDMKHYIDNEDKATIVLGEESSNSRYQHNDWMIPHWKELFKALQLRGRADKLETFYIRHIHLPVSVLDIMVPALQSMNNLKKLGFKCTDLGNDGWQRLISVLKRNSSLHELYINGDNIDDVSFTSIFSEALKEHPTLEQLIYYNGGLNNNATALRVILEGCTRLNHVELTDNLGSEAVEVLADFISGNHPTAYIFLKHNKITDSDTILLASALYKNTNLLQLGLRDNYITEEGERTLFNVIFDPTSMDSIVESNHRCVPHICNITNQTIWSQIPSLEREVFKINLDDDMSIQQKIRKNVILALCRQDGELFDLSHLNGLPLQLMPRVLGMIQEHSLSRTEGFAEIQLEKDALSRLFHTLRGWELPLLFENLSPGKRKRRKTRR